MGRVEGVVEGGGGVAVEGVEKLGAGRLAGVDGSYGGDAGGRGSGEGGGHAHTSCCTGVKGLVPHVRLNSVKTAPVASSAVGEVEG